MKLKINIIALIALSLFSCKKEVVIEDDRFRTWLNPDFETEKGFSLSLNITVVRDDVFKVYYAEDEASFTEKNTIKSKIKGRKEAQTITFNFPKEKKPIKFRIDLGSNKKQDFFRIGSVELKNPNNRLVIHQDSLFNYLEIHNKNLLYDSINNYHKVVKKPNKKYLPALFSNNKLSQELVNWYTNH